MNRTLFRHLILNILILNLFSCVGTINNKNPDQSKSATTKAKSFQYTGLISAQGVSDSKVQIEFAPYKNDNTRYNYLIYINDTLQPIILSGSSLVKNASGNFVYLISNLNPSSLYNVRISIKDMQTNGQSLNETTLNASTFKNNTCDFNGILNAYAPPGINGNTSIQVSWIPAKRVVDYMPIFDFEPQSYEVYYISEKQGNPDYLKSHLNILTPKSVLHYNQTVQSSTTFTNLAANTNYYFLVRCIHKGWSANSSISGYQKEVNTKIMAAKTNDSSITTYSFPNTNIIANTPAGILGKDSASLSWFPATGAFLKYQISYVEVDANGANLPGATAQTTDISSDFTQGIVSGLTEGSRYKFKIFVCKTNSCDVLNRLESSSVSKYIIPLITFFGGITSVNNPTTEANPQLSINFTPPSLSTGVFSAFNLYCYTADPNVTGNPTKDAGTLITSSASNTSGNDCSFLSYPAASSLATSPIKINIPSNKLGITYYFSIVPTYTSSNNTVSLPGSNISTYNFLYYSINPILVPPSLTDFSGITSCDTSDIVNHNLTLSWNEPLGGIYSKYEIYYKNYLKDDGNGNLLPSPFSFNTAISDLNSSIINTTSSEYKMFDTTSNIPTCTSGVCTLVVNNNSMFTYGEKIYFGILTNTANNLSRSPYNAGVIACNNPLPTASFKEWMDIFAIGPKIDGLIDASINSIKANKAYQILETLDQNGRPVEINNDALDLTVSGNQNVIASSLTYFKTYRKINSNYYYVRGQYDGANDTLLGSFSRNGIVKIKFKDVLLEGTTELSSLRTSSSSTTGYKIYRSEDNGITWIDLTSSTYYNGSSLSSDYIYSQNTSYHTPRNNQAGTYVNTITFVDYSVKALEKQSDHVERARSYKYKVVPFLNGQALNFSNTSPQNIITVTLPPANMALVHRLIANKVICSEMGKVPSASNTNGFTSWDVSTHYKCPYNGLGATLKTSINPVTYYDIRGDLLVDRFELGCNFTRPSAATNDGGACYFTGPSSTSVPTLSTSHQKFANDCLSDERHDIPSDPLGRCTIVGSPSSIVSFIFPLDPSTTISPTCTDMNAGYDFNTFFNTNNNNTFSYQTNVLKSQNLAVFANKMKSGSYDFLSLPGKNGQITRPTSSSTSTCLINFNYDSISNTNLPRWISASSLMHLSDSNVALNLNFASKETDVNSLYNNTDVKKPSNLFSSKNTGKNLGQIIASNNSRLPPITNLDQADAANLCNSFSVGVYYTNTINSTQQEIPLGSVKPKRLPRKQEFMAISSWPESLSNISPPKATTAGATFESSINKLEDGTLQSTTGAIVTNKPLNLASTLNNSCNSLSSANKRGQFNLLNSDILQNNYSSNEATNITALLIAGSSSIDHLSPDLTNFIIDGGNYASTDACVSRYGIQDLVGNVSEHSSEQFYCNIDAYNFYFHNPSTTYLDPNAPITGLRQAPIYSPDTYYMTDKGGTVMVSSSSTTTPGYCSPVGPNVTFLQDFMLGSSYLPLQFINSVDFLKNDLDPQSPDYLRDGVTGSFLTYRINSTISNQGLSSEAQGFGDPWRSNDTLSIFNAKNINNNIFDSYLLSRINSGNTTAGKFSPGGLNNCISPATGFPIDCASSTNDNIKMLIDNFSVGGDAGKNPTTVNSEIKIPTNNSQIYNDGVQEYVTNTSTYTKGDITTSFGLMPILFDPIYNSVQSGSQIIATPVLFNSATGKIETNKTITVPASSDQLAITALWTTNIPIQQDLSPVVNPAPVNKTSTVFNIGNLSGNTITNFSFARTYWKTNRDAVKGSVLKVKNGGDYTKKFNGRYAMQINSYSNSSVGQRCIVKINTGY